jgi:hypothetical protein
MEDADAALVMASADARVARSEKKSSRQIPSSKALRSLILGIGRTAKCALLVLWVPSTARLIRECLPPVACLANHFHHQIIRSFDYGSTAAHSHCW